MLDCETNDKNCFVWSRIAHLHSITNSLDHHPSKVSVYRQLNIQGFDFTTEFNCSDAYNFEKLTNLSKNKIEKFFYQDQSKWKNRLFHVEIIKKVSDRVVDF